jgi:hypothetical protein
MKKILFAIVIMALTAAALGYSYEFEVTSNAVGDCDITLMFEGSPLQGGSGSLHFDYAGTQSITITPNSPTAAPNCAKIDARSEITQPVQFIDQFYFSPILPVTHVNEIEIDIDGIEYPGHGENPAN